MSGEIYYSDFGSSTKPFLVDLTPSQFKYLVKIMPSDYVLELNVKKPQNKTLQPPAVPLAKKPSVTEPIVLPKPPSIKSEARSLSTTAPHSTHGSNIISLEIPQTIKQPSLPPMIKQPSAPPMIKQPSLPPMTKQPSAPPIIKPPSVPPIIKQPSLPPPKATTTPPIIKQPSVPPAVKPQPVLEKKVSVPPPEKKAPVIEPKPVVVEKKPPPVQEKKPVVPEKKAPEHRPAPQPQPQANTAITSKSFKPLDEMMRRCVSALQKVKKHICAGPFLYPVDVKALGLTDYYTIIKEPMDLSTVDKNLKNGFYPSPREFATDVRKIWSNAMTYNAEGSEIYRMTAEMRDYFERIYKDIEASLPPVPVPVIKEPYDLDKQIKRLCKAINKFHHTGGKFVLIDSQASKFNEVRDKPMSSTEKKILYQNLHKLPTAYLKGVWDIISDEVSEAQKEKETVEVDLEILSVETARKLERFVNFQTNHINRGIQKRAAAAASKNDGEMKDESENGRQDDDTSVSSFASESEEGEEELMA